MGVELPVSAAFPVCQPARDHGVGAGHRLPLYYSATTDTSGTAEITATFKPGTDVEMAQVDV
ncbi:hypothetical protein RFX04_02540, partial [Acinetobacter baumannii]|nr:hypothetical protein [Acinetobacter baumannii]